ncbi:MAG: hypothetical protein GEV04_06760 [Actinophytocola sp.]|nr:hypothetical protein [Actinophytocola sp.]
MRHVWIRTFSDGLVRADQVVGITAHRTPSLVGKPSRWLLDISLIVPAGSGTTDGWDISDLHRTILQTDWEPRGATDSLARLLHRLSGEGQGGVIRAVAADRDVRFEFDPFVEPDSSIATNSRQS